MGNYDPKTEVTLNGTVEKVEYTNYGNMRGVHLTLKAENGTLEVHLGPAAFVEKTMTFKGGDNIQVIGSKLTMVGKPAVIAREVTKGDKVLKLWDETGVPLWSGGHRRGRRIS
jgi:DNA/RNA endonuclease YhcR with UshA esterase domain